MRRRTLAALAFGAVAVVLAVAAVLLSGGGSADPGSKPPAAAGHDAHTGGTNTGTGGTSSSTASAPGTTASALTVEQLAAAVGCQARIDLKAADYRQATCTAAGAQLVFIDFDTAEGQRAWLDYAQLYGGVYLVGNRWALSGKSKEYLESLRAKLGGTVVG
jgi:hypothetical protein